MRGLALVPVLLLGVCALPAQPYTPGTAYFGRNSYVEYIAGNLPVILTAPHGGSVRPAEIPDRTYGTTVTDTNTQELTRAVYSEIVARTGRHPHVVICRLNRIKLDANREIVEAAQGNVFAEQAWTEYHDYIVAARAQAEAEFGFGFLIDIHGHGHDVQRLELGYNLGADTLNLSDTILNRPGYAWASYYRTLVHRLPGVSFTDLMRGPRSLGAYLAVRDIPSWPSPDFPTIGTEPFFAGGYTTDRHTCLDAHGPVNGVQIETHWTGIRDNSTSRASFARGLAQALQSFLYQNFGYSIGTNPLYTLSASSQELIEGGAPVTVTVLRSGYQAFSSSVALQVSGSATAGTDFTLPPASVSYASNVTTATFNLSAAADALQEGDETIELQLVPTSVQTADTTPLVLRIRDANRIETRPVVPARVRESDGSVTFTLRRIPSASAATVSLMWSGTARPGGDYELPAGLESTATLAANQTELPIRVRLVDDAVMERTRSLTLTLVPTDGWIQAGPIEATTQIEDDDRPRNLSVWLPGEVTGNQLRDESGSGRHATTLPAGAGPTQVTGFSSEPAMAFNGSEQTAVLPQFAVDPAGAFSVAFRFRITSGSTASNQRLLSYGEEGAANSLTMYLSSSSNLRTNLRDGAGVAAASDLDVTGTWINNTWRHVVVTADPSGGRRVYIDGTLARSAAGWSAQLDPTKVFWLGWQPVSLGSVRFLRGGLQDVQIYSRAISADEARALSAGRWNHAAWRNALGLGAPPAAATDGDGDGWPDLLEYALGSHPGVAGQMPDIRATESSGRMSLRFARHVATSDLTWYVEAAATPAGPWSVLASRTSASAGWTNASGVASSEANGLATVTDSVAIGGGQSRFLRLRVE